MDIQEIEAVLFGKKRVSLDPQVMERVSESYRFLEKFSKNKVIYGINTGFGPMAQYRINNEDLIDLQYNIIRSHSTGAGEPLPPVCVRAAMMSRLQTFLSGKSGVHPGLIETLVAFLNNEIYPFIPQHGSVGASGDLVQLAHLALTLIGEGEVYYKGEWQSSAKVMEELGIEPFKMHIREGLAVCNGTGVMTGIGLVNLFHAKKLLKWSIATSVLVNEIAASFDDFMTDELNSLKGHWGQSAVASLLREQAKGSGCLKNRDEELYQKEHTETHFDHKVQPYYSLRCIPQVLGPVLETVSNVEKVLVEEFNGVDDNPIVDMDNGTIFHGGNFHGDYVSFEMDKLKIAITKLTMLAERQMNYLFHDKINEILPPFVNLGKIGLNYGMQACQFTATSTTAECQTLSNPMYVHSIPNNNDNQDIVSMGTNSALIAGRIIENSFQVMAIHTMAIVQAVDFLKIKEKLSPKSAETYNAIRSIVPVFVDDTPKYKEIANIISYLKENNPNL
ncbi:MAG: aromatic amino acid lyase [Bacteroidales bacterium]|nr:aromatic amino acid lyase [Bacteroidales bacterium]